MLAFDSGIKIVHRKRIGPAPASCADYASESGIVRKNWRNRNVPVADAMSGTVSPQYVLTQPSTLTTWWVETMRTGTGSIRVTKIIQKTTFLPRKSKYTMANAESSEITILPMATPSATIALLTSIRAISARCHAYA